MYYSLVSYSLLFLMSYFFLFNIVPRMYIYPNNAFISLFFLISLNLNFQYAGALRGINIRIMELSFYFFLFPFIFYIDKYTNNTISHYSLFLESYFFAYAGQ